MTKKDVLKRIEALQREKEMNEINKRLAELTNQLYDMDVEAMQYEVDRGLISRESADKELRRRREKYFA